MNTQRILDIAAELDALRAKFQRDYGGRNLSPAHCDNQFANRMKAHHLEMAVFHLKKVLAGE